MSDDNNSSVAQSHMTLHGLLQDRARRVPDLPAIVGLERPPLSYRDLYDQVVGTARALNVRGIRRSDRVAIVLPGGPELAAAVLSVAACATSAPLNPAYRHEEFSFYLADLKAKALMVAAGTDSPAIDVATALGISVIELRSDTSAPAGVFTFAGALDHLAEPVFAESSDVALALHTSGTTARPKLVPLTHHNLCVSAGNVAESLALTQADRCLNVMPLFHIHGLVGATLASLWAGGSVVCPPGFVAPDFFPWMSVFTPTWYTGVPTMHQAILARAGQHPQVIDRHRLRLIRSSSSALPPQVMAHLEAVFGVPVIEAYGMTEAAHQIACNPLPPAERKPGAVGLPAGPEMAIMDDDGNLLPAGQTGEIVIRGSNVTAGSELM